MKVLVTGSSGFIGTALKAVLERNGHECLSYDLPKHDVCSKLQLDIAVKGGGVEGIINLAGMLGTPELFGHEHKAATVNILGALNVYDVAAEAGIPIVQIGTGHKGQPNPYAITKGCAEDLGLCRAQYRDEKINVVRAYHVYGPGQPVGPPHGTAHVNKFFPTFACRSLTNLPLELCGSGFQKIDAVYVDDVAEVLVDALNAPYGQTLEAGTGYPLSVADVAWDIRREVAYSTSKLQEVQGRDGEPRDVTVVAENPLCTNLWPYKVRETVEWYRQWLTR